uniref:(northern house mosquito) hypothetical protein n=1 Tax=Culex pipiens TaxID=7175 RepID=A0A8D8CL50_CULPI
MDSSIRKINAVVGPVLAAKLKVIVFNLQRNTFFSMKTAYLREKRTIYGQFHRQMIFFLHRSITMSLNKFDFFLNPHDIDNETVFMLLTESKVIGQMGLSLGNWLMISSIQANIASICHDEPSPSGSLIPEITVNSVKCVLENDVDCQKLVRGKLFNQEALEDSEKSWLNRALCSHFFGPTLAQKKRVTIEQKQQLAICVVTAYECLSSDVQGKPAEADWFWANNGESTGEHTGFIQHWIRNKQRKSNNKTIQLTPEITEMLSELQSIEMLDENQERISDLMEATFAYRNEMRKKSKDASWLEMAPMFFAFNGLMIHLEFDAIFPNHNDCVKLATLEKQLLVLNSKYDDVANAGIRALLKLSFELKDQGGSSESLPHLEQYCAPLVRWLQDPDQAVEDFLDVELPVFILCDNLAFAEGGYWVIANNKVVSRGTQFHEAFDIFFKSFHVLKLDYPSSFKRVMSFVETFCYGVKEFSRLKIVDKMLARFRKALC